MTPLELGVSIFIFILVAFMVLGILILVESLAGKNLFCRINHRWEMVNSDGKYEYQQCRRCPKNRIVIH